MKYTHYVTGTECGYDGLLCLESVFMLSQDYISDLFGDVGLDNRTLREKYNSMWVFTKNRARLFYRPHWNEKLDVNCRVVKFNRYICYCQTDFSIDGKLILEVMTEICALDKKSFRFVSLDTFKNLPLQNEEGADCLFKFENKECFESSRFQVDQVLCDISRHMNNAKALIPFISSLSLEQCDYFGSRPVEIGIKYQKQGMLLTKLTLSKCEEENAVYFDYLNDAGEVVEAGYIKAL